MSSYSLSGFWKLGVHRFNQLKLLPEVSSSTCTVTLHSHREKFNIRKPESCLVIYALQYTPLHTFVHTTLLYWRILLYLTAAAIAKLYGMLRKVSSNRRKWSKIKSQSHSATKPMKWAIQHWYLRSPSKVNYSLAWTHVLVQLYHC